MKFRAVSPFSYSVVIPTLNEEASISDAICSAIRSGADQIVVVDGGSSDLTRTIAASFPCDVIEAQGGRGAQLRAGAALATGSVLVFLHADSMLPPAGLQQIAAYLKQTTPSDATSPEQRGRRRVQAWGCFRQRIRAEGRRYRWLERCNAWRARHRQLVYGDQCLWTTRDFYEHVGGFPAWPLMEDVALSDRLSRFARPHLLYGPVTTSARRWQRRGVVRQTAKNWILYSLYRARVSPKLLSAWYR